MKCSYTIIFILSSYLCLAQNQVISSNTGTVQQNNGNGNTNIGIVNGPVYLGNPDTYPYLLLKLRVNTQCQILIDGEDNGLSTIDIPVKVKLKTGVSRIIAKSIHFPDLIIDTEIVVKTNEIGYQKYMQLNFDLEGYLWPVQMFVDGKWGYLNYKTHELVLPFSYENAGNFSEGIAIVKKGNKYGAIDKYGDNVVPFIYDEMQDFYDGQTFAKLNSKWAIINSKGEALTEFTYSEIFRTQNKYRSVQNRNTKYNWREEENEGVFIAEKNARHGVLNYKGKEIIPFEYRKIVEVPYGFKVAKERIYGHRLTSRYGSWGLFSTTGRCRVSPIYDDIYIDGHWGRNICCLKGSNLDIIKIINRERTELLNVVNYSEGCAIVFNGLAYGVTNTEDRLIIPIVYDAIAPCANGLIIVRRQQKYAIFKSTGIQLTSFKYDAAYYCRNGLIQAQLNGRYGYLNDSGKEITAFQFDSCTRDCSGEQIVSMNGKFGLIDLDGHALTTIAYDEISPLYQNDMFNSIISVRIGNKYGLITRYGRDITPVKYLHISQFLFDNQVATVRLANQSGLINTHGSEMIFFDCDGMVPISKYLFRGIKANKYFYINTAGQCVFGCN